MFELSQETLLVSAFGLAVLCDITNVLKHIQIMSDPLVIDWVCIRLYNVVDASSSLASWVM